MKQVDIKRESKKKNKNGIITQVDDKTEVPAIQILDPATGTGTFLREVILQIYDTFKANHKGKSETEIKKLWNEYVPKQLLPRLNGFELMMAPYAVAHMKLAMVLKDTGYDFESDERLRVVLTNTLEPSSTGASFMDEGQQMSFLEDPLAAEAFEADKTKNNQGINVIIGNPPYSGESANKGKWIMSLMEDYKKEPDSTNNLKEANSKFVNDDYVKFIRFAQHCVEKSGKGVVAFINPHGFIDSPTFRGMRWNLLKTFDTIYTIDLHGNAKRKETCIDGTKDENVFDIMQGVCIAIFIKNNFSKQSLNFYDLLGTRKIKYDFLQKTDLKSVNFIKSNCSSPQYYYNRTIKECELKYSKGYKTSELFNIFSLGALTKRDILSVSYSKNELNSQICDFLDSLQTTPQVCEKYKLPLKDNDKWNAEKTRLNYNKDLISKDTIVYNYRPFDKRYLLYNDLFVARQNIKVLKNIFINSPGLTLCRQGVAANVEVWDSIFIINIPSDQNLYRRGGATVFPLFTYSVALGKTIRTPNLKPEIVAEISEKLGLPFAPDSDGGVTESFAPIDLLDYIYAVLHSPKYRETYKEFLKIDFPRVPYPTDKEMFWKMVKLGGEIRKLHLMESPLFDTLITTYPVAGTNEVVKLNRKDNRVYINNEQYFDGVSDLAWNFYIGGYQPAQKWLKDRKGRNLSDEDILHYQKIIVALTETDRLMKEIDEIFIF